VISYLPPMVSPIRQPYDELGAFSLPVASDRRPCPVQRHGRPHEREPHADLTCGTVQHASGLEFAGIGLRGREHGPRLVHPHPEQPGFHEFGATERRHPS
jgi:hypothetical protein